MKVLTKNEYYTAMAHYLIASQHEKIVTKHVEEAAAVLGSDNWLTDFVYQGEEGTKENFDLLLEKEGIIVEDDE